MTAPASRVRRTMIGAMLSAGLGTRAFAAESPDATLRFGMSAPMTGTAGAYGLAMKKGIEACFQRVNIAGGVAGRKLELTALDDGYEVRPAVENAKRLIGQEQVFGLMGFYGTSPTAAVLPVLDATGVPLVGAVSGAAVLRKPFNKHIFHLRASYDDETAAIVRNLVTVGISRIAILYQDDGFGAAGLAGAKAALAAQRLQPVAVGSVARNSIDVARAVEAISAAQPQAVVMVTLYRPTAEFIRRMRQADLHPYFVALSPVGTDQLIADLGPENSRGIQVSQVIPHPWGQQLGVVREYQRDLLALDPLARFSYYGLEGYLDARLVVAALERCGRNPTRTDFMAALRAGTFDLAGFRVRFGSENNEGSNYVEISVIDRDGVVRI